MEKKNVSLFLLFLCVCVFLFRTRCMQSKIKGVILNGGSKTIKAIGRSSD